MKVNPEDIVYLNYAATSFPKSTVALDSFLKATSAPPKGARHNGHDAHLDDFRQRVASILNVLPEQIFFTSGATMGLNQIILGFMPGKKCVALDNRSHSAVAKPCFSLKEHCQVLVTPLYDYRDHFLVDALYQVLKSTPDLLCLTHASNVTGSIYPVEEIIQITRERSPQTAILVDAGQSAGAISLAGIAQADFVVFPAHKHLHSLPGAALGVAKLQIKQIVFGGTGHSSTKSDENTLEVGTLALPAIHAMVDSLEYAEATLQEHRRQKEDLLNLFLEQVKGIEELTSLGRPTIQDRLGIVALQTHLGSPELHWVPFLKSQNIIVRGGLHCSPLLHQELGLPSGSLRFSFGWGSTVEHIEKAIHALKEFSKFAKVSLK